MRLWLKLPICEVQLSKRIESNNENSRYPGNDAQYDNQQYLFPVEWLIFHLSGYQRLARLLKP